MASIARRPDGTYRPRFRDESGKEHARHFKRKVDAQRWLDEQTAAMVTGAYVDPRSGRMTFAEYAEQWRTTQVVRPTTGLAYERVLRRNVYPRLGNRPLSSIDRARSKVSLPGSAHAPRPAPRWLPGRCASP